MDCKCHSEGCEKMIEDNYYCEECFNKLQKQKKENMNIIMNKISHGF
jgi:DNA-binding FrmR family transcriptional regulator